MDGFNSAIAVEESELMAQLLSPYPFLNEQEQDYQALFCTGSYYNSQDANGNNRLCYWSQESDGGDVGTSMINASDFFAPPFDHLQACGDQMVFNMEGAMNNVPPSSSFGCQAYMNEETSSVDDVGDSAINSSALDQKSQHKRMFSMEEVNKPIEADDKHHILTNNPMKKAKATSQVPRSSKNTKSKKTQKSKANGGEENNNVPSLNVQSSSSCCSEDESNASQELNGGGGTSPHSKEPSALNLNGKARANRGSATDPQSLYARKRRERINERLRILQTLVPNGTKVDISTMLEEAVQYVKFLQLQIKLLSSDDLWMYAPLAYNGMDIGLDLKISQLQK